MLNSSCCGEEPARQQLIAAAARHPGARTGGCCRRRARRVAPPSPTALYRAVRRRARPAPGQRRRAGRPGTTITTRSTTILRIKLDFTVPESAAVLARARTGDRRAQRRSGRRRVRRRRRRHRQPRRSGHPRGGGARAAANPDVPPARGHAAAVAVRLPERQALVLPEIAVQQEGSAGCSVFRVGAGDAVALVPVTLGSRHDGKVEIASGLKPGDRIVVEGIVKLHDGSKVVEAWRERARRRRGMKISDISIHRPVLATVGSLLLVVLGVIAFTRPRCANCRTSIRRWSRSHHLATGASAAVMETRVTKVLEDAVSGIEGVDTLRLESEKRRFQHQHRVHPRPRHRKRRRTTRCDAVSRNLGKLPDDADPPQVRKGLQRFDVIPWFNLSAPGMVVSSDGTAALTDYAQRYPRRPAVDDGRRRRPVQFARRAGLMRCGSGSTAMPAARGLTVGDIEPRLRARIVDPAGGALESNARDSHPAARPAASRPRRLRAIARSAAAATATWCNWARWRRWNSVPLERRAHYRTTRPSAGQAGIVKTSTANDLAVAEGVRREIERINRTPPNGMLARGHLRRDRVHRRRRARGLQDPG